MKVKVKCTPLNEQMTVEIIEAKKITKCPECGIEIEKNSMLLISENQILGHLSKAIFDELIKTAEKKGVPFETFFAEVFNGMMLTYLVKWRNRTGWLIE